jgi:hypothetical protein
LTGINYDIPPTKTGFNAFQDLVGLSPAVITESLSLSKDIVLSDSIADLVFVDRYYSKTYGMSLIFVRTSNDRPYIRYKDSLGNYTVEELPAPPSFPLAADWNGVQIDTRYYLQTYNGRKRYVVRFDADEEYCNEIELENNSIVLAVNGFGNHPNNFEDNYVDDQHTYYSLKSFISKNGAYSIINEKATTDLNKGGLDLYISYQSGDIGTDWYIFGSSTVDPNAIPEERLLASVVDGKFTFHFVTVVGGFGGSGTYYISTVNTTTRFNYIDFLCWFYILIGKENIVGASLFIDNIEYIIEDLWYNYDPQGGVVSNTSSIQINKVPHFPLGVPLRSYSFRLEYDISSIGFGHFGIPLYGNDVYVGTKTIYGDLISNYTVYSENIDAVGKAVVYADGFLFNGSPKYSSEDYENYLVNSFVNNLGVRQPLSFPITNLTPLGSKSGEMLYMGEKFDKIYVFTSEAIFIVDPNQGDPIVQEPIPINITSKYHITEFLNGFFIYSGFKVWRLGYDGLFEVPGINKYLKDNNITLVYMSWNGVDSEMMLYIPSTDKLFLFNYDRSVWRSWNPETPTQFISEYKQDGVSYQIGTNGNIYSISGTVSKGLLFNCEFDLSAFQVLDITEIRINGSFTLSDINAKIIQTDGSEVVLSVSHSSDKGYLQLYRDEGITLKEQSFQLTVFQRSVDTVTVFDVYGIEIFGIFEELEGSYPDESLTHY